MLGVVNIGEGIQQGNSVNSTSHRCHHCSRLSELYNLLENSSANPLPGVWLSFISFNFVRLLGVLSSISL
jgi:hypothetical protein